MSPKPSIPAIVDFISDQQDFEGALAPGSYAETDFANWWETIGGSELGGLIDALEAQNLELAAARARLGQAQALSRQALGARLPSLSASVEGGERRSVGSNGPLEWDDTYSAAATLSWNVDTFGGARNSYLSARLSLEAQALNAESLLQVLAAETTRAYVRSWSLSRQIEAAESSAESFAETARITDMRYRAGSPSVSALDVQLARQNEASARALIPELRASLLLQQQGMDVLLGQRIGTLQLVFTSPPDATALPPLGVGVPADLLRRRPDVRAAELAYRAALADVGAARAQLFPSLTLTGSLSQQTGDSSTLFNADNMIANLTAGLLAPLFQGGRLRAQVSFAEASAREVSSNYANAALQAAADVEGALVLEAAYEEQIELRLVSLKAAEIANQIARERYASGQASILAVLDAQRALNAARQDLVIAEQNRLEARIDLYLALGGDWRPMGTAEEGDVS